MSNNFKDFKFPESSTPRLIKVTQLSPSTEEQVVQEFFRFCGKVVEFAIGKSEDEKSQEALVLFEKDSAAKTAIMLSNSLIGDRKIVVQPYYSEFQVKANSESGSSQNKDGASQSRENSASTQSEEKNSQAGSSLWNTLWSTGYQLTQTVVQATQELDSQYKISDQMNAYLEKAKEETKKLDEQYQVSQTANELDSKYGVVEKLSQAASTAKEYGNMALETEQGKKVQEMYEKAVNSASELKVEAYRALNIESEENSENNQEASKEQNDSSEETTKDQNKQSEETSNKQNFSSEDVNSQVSAETLAESKPDSPKILKTEVISI
ncbi:Protein vip1 [Entomophthora muscae]|uniref:Protein vip1 n=1 Tax=Entomophthora muscae TaxID=34485 RepID=A0ACC2RZD9_9FUNG|nr:Protein vip1 [Entomophthora muscae]